jgi:hypothetical protein
MMIVGVPLISPVVELMDKFVGKLGDISQLVTRPPLTVGMTEVIAAPLVPTIEFEP